MALNTTISTVGQVYNRVYFYKLGDPMAYGDSLTVCEGSTETPTQAEIRHLKYQVTEELKRIKDAQERLLLARTKLAAVKKLVK